MQYEQRSAKLLRLPRSIKCFICEIPKVCQYLKAWHDAEGALAKTGLAQMGAEELRTFLSPSDESLGSIFAGGFQNKIAGGIFKDFKANLQFY